MKTVIWWLKSIGILLLALALVAGPWLANHALADAIPQPALGTVLQPTPAPTVQSSPAAADEQPRGSWLLMLLLIVCSMGGLLVVGVGAAILLVKLRERF